MHNLLSFSLCLCCTCRRSPTGPRASPEMPRWRRRSRPKLKCLRLRSVHWSRDSRPKQIIIQAEQQLFTTILSEAILSIYVYISISLYYIYVCIYIYTNIDAHEINNNCSSLIRTKTKTSTNNSSQGFAQHLNIWTICWIISLLYFNNYKFYFLM